MKLWKTQRKTKLIRIIYFSSKEPKNYVYFLGEDFNLVKEGIFFPFDFVGNEIFLYELTNNSGKKVYGISQKSLYEINISNPKSKTRTFLTPSTSVSIIDGAFIPTKEKDIEYVSEILRS